MRRFVCFFALAAFSASVAQAQTKRPLDHTVYDGWNSIVDQRLSDDGAWMLYALNPQDGDAELHVHSVQGATEHVVARGRSARFSGDGQWVVFLIKPELAATREAKLEEKKPDQQPKDSLGILNLSTGEVTRIARVKSFEVPEEEGGWVAYLMEKELEDSEEGEEEPEAPEEPEEEPAQEGEEEEDEKEDKAEGTTLVLRDLATGEEHSYERVTEYAFSEEGIYLAFAVSHEEGSDDDGVYVVRSPEGTSRSLMAGVGNYKNVTFDQHGEQLAFISDRDDFDSDQPSYTLYYWKANENAVQSIATQGNDGIPSGWWVSEHGDIEFSEEGNRLFFGTAPRPEPESDEEIPEWEEVKLDVWNWKDPLLQPNQLVQRERELERTYTAAFQVRNDRVVQLATADMPDINVRDGEGDAFLGQSNLPYRQQISWESPRFGDYFIVDAETGERRMIMEGFQGGGVQMSPDEKYVTWWDGTAKAWFAFSVDEGMPVNISATIPHRVDNELHDWPMLPSSYGSAGWTEDDKEFLVYDRHDIWALDPTGRRAPRNVTEGVGRAQNMAFRYIRLDPDADAIDPDEPMLLSAFDRTTKASGYAHDRVDGNGHPEVIMMDDYAFRFPRKAEDSDVLMFTRESFQEFRDLWVTGDASFSDMRKVSNANPQMDEFLWGTAELVHWRSTDGLPLDGVIYKPENFDPSQQYPMMVYFYEKMSDRLHSHRAPTPGGSSINISFYVSRGYVVFVPDIHYRVGYPGESAMDCVVSGVLSVLEKWYVDPARVGVQGHSWGGYQIAYMITQTDIFAAAEAGAPVSNMTSAYGGIRWQSGLSRMMQYEKSQSRIGGTLWEATPRYIANSPVFWADKVNTPVLMLHNDEDGAVPWYQGIEFFVALRRLGQPTWMLNYNGEAHGLRKYPNRKDWQQRMQQFFDHYLKDAPPPVWLAEGIPATEKGKTLGLELVEPEKPKATTGSEN